jgi:ribonuclease-3
MTDELDPLAAALGYAFRNPELLAQAVTHRSLVNELAQEPAPAAASHHNERLEFLGDAVVNLCVGTLLMQRLPAAREGELSKLRAMVVSEASLAAIAVELELGRYLRLGRGEEQTGGRRKASILSDAFEALMGAVFLDGGFAEAQTVIERLLGPRCATAEEGELDHDHKTRLQELVQGHWRVAPRYEVVEERGPDHAKVFTVEVLLGERVVARAEGHSKKAAEQRAARRALAVLSSPDPPDTAKP